MNFFINSALITAITSFLLGVFVLHRNRKSLTNKLWSLVCFGAFIWEIGLYFELISDNETEALVWNKILYIGAILLPIFYYHFVTALLEINKKKRNLLVVGYSLAIFYLTMNVFTRFFVEGVPPALGFNYWVKPGPLYYPYFIYFTAYFAISFYYLIKALKERDTSKKQQVKYMLLAGVFGVSGGVTVFFPQFFGIYPFGNYFVILYIVIVVYAIAKYRLMGIRVLVSKFYIYTLIASLSFFLFHAVYLISLNFFNGIYNPSALTFGVFMAFFFSAILFPFINYVQKSSDTLFFKGYNPTRIIKDLTIRLSSVIEINELNKILADEFKKILATDEVGVIIFKKNGNERSGATERKGVKANMKKSAAKNGNAKTMHMISESSSLNWANLKADNVICLEAIKLETVMIRSEINARRKDDPKAGALVSEMDKYKVEVIAPLIIGGKVTGLIVLGDKISQEGYTQEDIEFLEIISSQAAVAIENALLYKEIGEMNKNLQKKVEEKTTELRDKNEYLEKLLVMRSEFLDIASHQLRTPVTVIRGMTSMILEGGMPENKINEFLKAMLDKSGKLAEIINDILRASEMDSEKVLLKFTKVDLNTFLTKLVDDKQIQAKTNEIGLKLSLPKTPLPAIQADSRYLEQAIGNLINNSFQYTPKKGKVEVSAAMNGKNVEIRVSDTGIGIPAGDLPKLFSKFSRASNAIAMYTDGTGLGLFIVKRIIEEHKGGKVCVEKTVEGKGTTFLITLAA
ncbi:MAG: ATP-binding protein [Patescibacteria group bacterium]|jgi:signal transduction histidine kinase